MVGDLPARRVTPRTRNGDVFCPCGSLMHPEVGWRLDNGWFIWWRCYRHEHITDALPIPREWVERPTARAT